MNTFGFGVNQQGQLGIGKPQKEVHKPTKVLLPENTFISSVSCGGWYTLFLSQNGDVFSCGYGKYGRLGSGSETDQHTPIQINKQIKEKVVQISAGNWVGALLTENGKIYSWGKSSGTGIPSKDDILVPTPIHEHNPKIKDTRFTNVCCGDQFMFAIDDNGQLYGWGKNRDGILGSNKSPVLPQKIKSWKNRKIQKISCGLGHAGIISDSKLFMFGSTQDGCLGNGKEKIDSKFISIDSPVQVDFSHLTDSPIVSVSCNKSEHYLHTLVMSEKGQIFSFGSNYKSKLGVGEQIQKSSVPLSVDLQNVKSVPLKICAGGIHSALMTNDGFYTWGCGSNGRLGHSESENYRYLFRENIPRKVDLEAKQLIDADCSYYHSICVVSNLEKN
eukprot:Anaeramoba_ignava/a609162_32.p1 GENE.a609162_32~~a609162_32.p1  ORF type:complete len:387 (-),score=103.78 a609162_32:66-1226(-)